MTGSGLVIGPPLGSIIVNDMTFGVETAHVVIDGTPAAVSDLRLGMVVEVVARSMHAPRPQPAT